ncbi:hypothetical protein OQA88_9521 [Cercophora sp. LCS_1]
MAIRAEDLESLEERLCCLAREDHRARVHPDMLDHQRRDILANAISNVLSTELAISTYAQIIDGLPTANVGWERRSPGLPGDHPLDEHEELCPGSLEKSRELCRRWTLDVLWFNPKTLSAFRSARPGTKAFNTRLIELVAVSLHQFGALLFQLGFRLHKGDIDSVVKWEMPRPAIIDPKNWFVLPPRPTIFNHPLYLHDDIYPEGVADIVGYWAEDRILGAVVVFDRAAEFDDHGNQVENPPNAYFHPCRTGVTERVTQLRDDQQQELIDFLLAKYNGPVTPCSLPILVDKRNTVRVDADVAITLHGIYRDLWERVPLTEDEMEALARRPQQEIDYP